MLKAGEGHSILIMFFVASQHISGLKEDRVKHLPTVPSFTLTFLVCKTPVSVVIPEKLVGLYAGVESLLLLLNQEKFPSS